MSQTAAFFTSLVTVCVVSYLIGFFFGPSYPYIAIPGSLALGFFGAPALQKRLTAKAE